MENNRMQRGNMAARNYRAMNKSALHVRFEISFLNSYDMTMLREKHGIAGWGIAVFMMKYLIERRTDCRAPLYVISEIAHACHKSQKTILQIINDFPSLFQIDSNNKLLFSPYLQQFFSNCSANNEKSNRSLDKLTNEPLDNQEVSFSKNKELEQEQITTKEKKRKGVSLNPRGTSPNPSQGGEPDVDDRIVWEKEASPNSLLSSSRKLNEQRPNDSKGGEYDVEERELRRMRNRTAIHTAISCAKRQRKRQQTEMQHQPEHTSETQPSRVEMGVTRNLSSQLYQDNDYMTSLERIANLAVRTNFVVRRNLLFWFQLYCQSHAKRIKDSADAKDYLANLMRPGSKTRAQFMAYQNKLYSIEWAKRQAQKEQNGSDSGFSKHSNGRSSGLLIVSA